MSICSFRRLIFFSDLLFVICLLNLCADFVELTIASACFSLTKCRIAQLLLFVFRASVGCLL